MHWLSANNRSEFLACPELVRFDHAQGSDGLEPTLLIKGSTLLLKYVVLGVPMQLAFAKLHDRLLYAVRVNDDGDQGATLRSLAEREEEIAAIKGLAQGEPIVAFLFNELAVNVAWTNVPAWSALERLATWADTAVLGRIDQGGIKEDVQALIDRLDDVPQADDGWLVLEVAGAPAWKPVHSHYVTNGLAASAIDLLNRDEGNQQEQLGIWLTDGLQAVGVHHSPQVPKGSGTRELTDLLLSHEFGAVLVKSKTLSIFARERLPARAKLKRDVEAHIAKAFAQLRDAIGRLKAGAPVTSLGGSEINVERGKPMHAIVLIPDLTLIDEPEAYGTAFMRDFLAATGGFPHLLDVAELLRMVQAAEMISARSETVTPLMAFDHYLVERVKRAFDAGTLRIEVLLRFAEDQIGE